MTKYSRVLLKLSGEAFAGGRGSGIDSNAVENYAREIKEATQLGVQVAAVIGGGNFWRSRMAPKMDRVTADHMGMMATVINALALRDALEQRGVVARVQTAIEIKDVAEPFIRLRAIRHLEKGRVVIFAGGTGSAYFTTDTAAALRGLEIKAEAILKATRVDGIYDRDPEKFEDARFFPKLTHDEAFKLGLRIMDSTAFSLCKDNDLPILVFNIFCPGNLLKALKGEDVGSLVRKETDDGL